MASASDKKRGVCGHAMASFDPHEWCARCRKKVVGSDPCVRGEEPCKYCVVLTPYPKIKAVSPLKTRPSSALVTASVTSACVSNPSSDLDKRLDSLQDE